MDMPSKCYECVMRNKSMCGITGLYLPRLDVIRGDCPLKSTDDMIAEINNLNSPKTDTEYQDGFYDCEKMALDVIDKYCEGAQNESTYRMENEDKE